MGDEKSHHQAKSEIGVLMKMKEQNEISKMKPPQRNSHSASIDYMLSTYGAL